MKMLLKGCFSVGRKRRKVGMYSFPKTSIPLPSRLRSLSAWLATKLRRMLIQTMGPNVAWEAKFHLHTVISTSHLKHPSHL